MRTKEGCTSLSGLLSVRDAASAGTRARSRFRVGQGDQHGNFGSSRDELQLVR